MCEGFECEESYNGWCYGLYVFKHFPFFRSDIFVTKTRRCIATTSLVHELIHFFNIQVEGLIDDKHEKYPFWPSSLECKKLRDDGEIDLAIECENSSLAKIVNLNIRKKLCNQ